MYQQAYKDVPGSLFVAVHHGVRYTLVCVHDGRYAIAKNGWLMPARWRLKDFNMCFRTFMHMVGRTYKEPTPASCLLAEDLIAKQDPPGTLSFEPGRDVPEAEAEAEVDTEAEAEADAETATTSSTLATTVAATTTTTDDDAKPPV